MVFLGGQEAALWPGPGQAAVLGGRECGGDVQVQGWGAHRQGRSQGGPGWPWGCGVLKPPPVCPVLNHQRLLFSSPEGLLPRPAAVLGSHLGPTDLSPVPAKDSIPGDAQGASPLPNTAE